MWKRQVTAADKKECKRRGNQGNAHRMSFSYLDNHDRTACHTDAASSLFKELALALAANGRKALSNGIKKVLQPCD